MTFINLLKIKEKRKFEREEEKKIQRKNKKSEIN